MTMTVLMRYDFYPTYILKKDENQFEFEFRATFSLYRKIEEVYLDMVSSVKKIFPHGDIRFSNSLIVTLNDY
jgi:hypothetical protein